MTNCFWFSSQTNRAMTTKHYRETERFVVLQLNSQKLKPKSELLLKNSHVFLSSTDRRGVCSAFRLAILTIWVQIHFQNQSNTEGKCTNSAKKKAK